MKNDKTTMPDLPPELMDLYRQAAVDQSMRQHESEERSKAAELSCLAHEGKTLDMLIASDQLPEAVRPYVKFDWRTSTSDYRPFSLLVELPEIAPIMVHWVWGGTAKGQQPVGVGYSTPMNIEDDEDGVPIYSDYHITTVIFAKALYNAVHHAPSMKKYIEQKAAEKARREDKEQATAAALKAEADHDEGIRQLLQDRRGDDAQVIQERLTAIGMILYDISLALQGRLAGGAK